MTWKGSLGKLGLFLAFCRKYGFPDTVYVDYGSENKLIKFCMESLRDFGLCVVRCSFETRINRVPSFTFISAATQQEVHAVTNLNRCVCRIALAKIASRAWKAAPRTTSASKGALLSTHAHRPAPETHQARTSFSCDMRAGNRPTRYWREVNRGVNEPVKKFIIWVEQKILCADIFTNTDATHRGVRGGVFLGSLHRVMLPMLRLACMEEVSPRN